jgi:hypothetical protein
VDICRKGKKSREKETKARARINQEILKREGKIFFFKKEEEGNKPMVVTFACNTHGHGSQSQPPH